MQFICFVGHSFAAREAKIGFLAFDEERQNVKLCWLVSYQPFKKKNMTDLADYSIV